MRRRRKGRNNYSSLGIISGCEALNFSTMNAVLIEHWSESDKKIELRDLRSCPKINLNWNLFFFTRDKTVKTTKIQHFFGFPKPRAAVYQFTLPKNVKSDTSV